MRIITDSASDITQAEAKEMNITVCPLLVRFGMEEFRDGMDITMDEFYQRLSESENLPTTSAIAPGMFEEYYGEGEDVLAIIVSSKLSSTYQSAVIAKGDREDVEVVDSLNAALGQRLLVELAVRLRDEGKNIHEIAAILNEKKKNIRLIALLNTLENLRKGGRISSSVAAIGTLLVIKPVIQVVDGVVEMSGKARGAKNGRKIMQECIEATGEIDFDYPYTLAYSGMDAENLIKYVEEHRDFWNKSIEELRVVTIGAVIGTHAGSGACAVAYFAKEN